jgi:hypothetical protein
VHIPMCDACRVLTHPSQLKAKDWPKRKFRVTFLAGQHFHWPGGDGYKVKRLNLRSMYIESGPVSYMREALALQLFKQAGVPCADSFYVRLFLNGKFYGLFLAVEDIDKRWLARRNFANTTLLLKSEHYKYSNLRAPDSRLDCPQTAPDQDYPGKGRGKGRDCPIIYQVVNPPLPTPWDRRWDGVINNFTTSLQEVVNRVSWAGVNDSFVRGACCPRPPRLSSPLTDLLRRARSSLQASGSCASMSGKS